MIWGQDSPQTCKARIFLQQYQHWILNVFNIFQQVEALWSNVILQFINIVELHVYRVAQKECNHFDCNFMNIVDETELFFILFGRTFIFQQNDTIIISFG